MTQGLQFGPFAPSQGLVEDLLLNSEFGMFIFLSHRHKALYKINHSTGKCVFWRESVCSEGNMCVMRGTCVCVCVLCLESVCSDGKVCVLIGKVCVLRGKCVCVLRGMCVF